MREEEVAKGDSRTLCFFRMKGVTRRVWERREDLIVPKSSRKAVGEVIIQATPTCREGEREKGERGADN
jgi:hypothetical protein